MLKMFITTTLFVFGLMFSPGSGNPIGCEEICPHIYDPVCGSDGNTYSNNCSLRRENCKRHPRYQIQIVKLWACNGTATTQQPETTTTDCNFTACTLIYAPVCGSDGVTYGNACELRLVNCGRSPYNQITIVKEGECNATTTSSHYTTKQPETTTRDCNNIACADIYDPVCGSDGVTYANECELGRVNCGRSPYDQITIVKKGECDADTTPTLYTTRQPETTTTDCNFTACPLIYDPVCGSDGVTYGNECELRRVNCGRSPYNQITIVKKGECNATTTSQPYTTEQPESTTTNCNDIVCLLIFDPVCGSDGVTYGNDCELRRVNCGRSPYDQITIVKKGECNATTTSPPYTTKQPETTTTNCNEIGCVLIYDPVCGSDGVTYGNECELGLVNCGRSPYNQITIVKKGECNVTTTSSPYTTQQPETNTTNCNDIMCLLVYDPVCGSDEVTYGNVCELGRVNCGRSPYDQITIVNKGECNATTTSPPYTTQPPETTTTNCNFTACTRIYAPVCGSDGVTYSNECELRSENCRRSPYDQITIVNKGECNVSTTPTPYTTLQPETTTANCNNIACTRIYAPVCGSDGVTYGNECELRRVNCGRSPYDQITIVKEGECNATTTPTPYTTQEPETTTRDCNNIVCPAIYKPVCGSDGVTYSNGCYLFGANCGRPADKKITKVKDGPCHIGTTSSPYTTQQPETTTQGRRYP